MDRLALHQIIWGMKERQEIIWMRLMKVIGREDLDRMTSHP